MTDEGEERRSFQYVMDAYLEDGSAEKIAFENAMIRGRVASRFEDCPVSTWSLVFDISTSSVICAVCGMSREATNFLREFSGILLLSESVAEKRTMR